MKIYLAGPIFNYGDYLRNKEWAYKIRKEFPGVDLYSPVENTDINGVEGKKKFANSTMIANADNERLDNTDILIACIDGDVLPSGTCAEIGKFHEKIARGDNKHIIGICTDTRQCFLTHSEAKDKGGAKSLGEQQYSYQNLYVTGLIKKYGTLVYSIEEVIEELHKYIPKKEYKIELSKRYKDIIKLITSTYKKEKQVLQTIEEMSELSKELLKNINRGEDNINEIILELADVEIMLEQIKIFYNINNEKLLGAKEYKLLRQENRIKKEGA